MSFTKSGSLAKSFDLGQNRKKISTTPKQNKDGKITRFYLPTALSLIWGGRGGCYSILFRPRVPSSQKKQRNQTIEFFRGKVRRIFGSKIQDFSKTKMSFSRLWVIK